MNVIDIYPHAITFNKWLKIRKLFLSHIEKRNRNTKKIETNRKNTVHIIENRNESSSYTNRIAKIE